VFYFVKLIDAIIVFHGFRKQARKTPKHATIGERAGTSRSRVTAIANDNTQGFSTDVLIRVLAATGYRAQLRVKKAAA
jgi:predicted XRE-type DNA-binding protein